MAKEKTKHDGLLCFLLALIVVLTVVVGGGLYYFLVIDNPENNKPNEDKISEVKSNYYEPTNEEKERAEQLAGILRNNLPKIDGSTSTIPLEGGVIASLFNMSQENAEAGVVHSTTYGSYDNLMENNCDIIFSTPLSEEQYNTARTKNIELEVVPVVYEGFVFVVNASNPVNTLSQQQIKDIYSGKITNWKEVGGNDAEIVAYQRNATSGSQNYMTAFMGETKLMEPKTDFIPASMVGLMDAIATYDNAENAIGYSVYAYAADMYGNGNEIKFIKVDGVEPTKATMAAKEYPLLNYNYAIYNKAKIETTTVDELTEWILTYDGQVAMANAGYIPIKNIKTEESTITPYDKKGTGEEKSNNYELDTFKYVVGYSSTILKNNRIIGLKNKELQNEINKFIEDSEIKLANKEQEFKNYLELLNNRNNYKLYGCEYVDGKESPIVTKVECINGYLSVQVYLKYEYQVQAGTPYIYDGYSAIFDLYTGKKLELSDLYFKNTNFISMINEEIKYTENHTPDLTPDRTFKRTFVAVPEDIKMYSLTTIGFTKFNPYFGEGEIFYLDNYSKAINKVIYKARDMKDIWDSSIKVDKELNRYSFDGGCTPKEKDNIVYGIYSIETNNANVDKKINNYIQNYIETKATPEAIKNYINNNENLDFLSDREKIAVDIFGQIFGNEIALVTVDIYMTGYDELLFDLHTGDLIENTTYEEWMKQKGMW